MLERNNELNQKLQADKTVLFSLADDGMTAHPADDLSGQTDYRALQLFLDGTFVDQIRRSSHQSSLFKLLCMLKAMKPEQYKSGLVFNDKNDLTEVYFRIGFKSIRGVLDVKDEVHLLKPQAIDYILEYEQKGKVIQAFLEADARRQRENVERSAFYLKMKESTNRETLLSSVGATRLAALKLSSVDIPAPYVPVATSSSPSLFQPSSKSSPQHTRHRASSCAQVMISSNRAATNESPVNKRFQDEDIQQSALKRSRSGSQVNLFTPAENSQAVDENRNATNTCASKLV